MTAAASPAVAEASIPAVPDPAQRTPRTLPPPGGRRYRMTIAYDGTDYLGWQRQPHAPTIQGDLEKALAQLTGEQPAVHSCGRTDAGVHAWGQVAHFDLARPWRAPILLKALNAVLPPTIRIRVLRAAPPTFHARYDALGKEYRYTLFNAPIPDPCLRRTTLHVRSPLDLAAMREAAARLVGCHDFAAFSANPNREIGSTVRTLYRLEVQRRGPLVLIRAVGDGFLYKMVRSLAGHLVRVGRHAVPAAETDALLAARQRTARVETAPPHALSLHCIHYAGTAWRRPAAPR